MNQRLGRWTTNSIVIILGLITGISSGAVGQTSNSLLVNPELFRRHAGVSTSCKIVSWLNIDDSSSAMRLRRADCLDDITRFYLKKGDVKQALEYLTYALTIEEKVLVNELNASGSESKKRKYIKERFRTTNTALSLHMLYAPNDRDAMRLAFTTILRRKGRALEAFAANLYSLRQTEHKEIIEQLNTIYSQIASLIFARPVNLSVEQYRKRVATLKQKAQSLENEVSSYGYHERQIPKSVSLENIQNLIPPNAALIEFASYHPWNAKTEKSEPSHYVAYILTPSGDIQWVDLGLTHPINREVIEFRSALKQGLRNRHFLSERSRSLPEIGRHLDEKLMQPIRQRLGNVHTLLISPESQLNLIPFAALIDENNRYLLENYSITYLVSGRELLRLQKPTLSRSNPVIIANPDYQTPGDIPKEEVAIQSPDTDNQRSLDLNKLQLDSLPGTQLEADALASFFPDAVKLTGSQATENALKQLAGPRILHIATHGFFLENVELVALPNDYRPEAQKDYWRRKGWSEEASRIMAHMYSDTEKRPTQEDPLLRSGLALAGFNLRQSGKEDGILTAMEAATLDLAGTQLVVLSACETAVGEVVEGEGVLGLRYAFTLSGAETLVLSLWKVDDKGTQDLMVNYYRRLLNNEGRSEALRQAQLEMLHSQKYQHPYYWAAFIPSGDWTPMRTPSINGPLPPSTMSR